MQQLAPEAIITDPQAFDEFKVATLAAYRGIKELLAETGCDPNPLFVNDFYVKANDLDDVGPVPLEHYVRNMGRTAAEDGYLEVSPYASMNFYMGNYPDLVAARVLPLVHLLEYGLREGREFFQTANTIRADFLENSATLYGDPRLTSVPHFVVRSRTTGQLAGPAWPTDFSQQSLPPVAHVAPAHKRQAMVGVVLYENTNEQVERLLASFRREVDEFADYRFELRCVANDPWNLERYRAILGDAVSLSSSGTNEGFGRAHNSLMREAFVEDRLYVGANPDGYFTPGCLKSLVDFSDYYDGRALIEASALPIDHPKWHDPILLDTQWVSGACFALERPVWRQTEGFDENIHMYCEDVDLSWRVRLAGGLLKVCPTARFVHDVTPRFVTEGAEQETASRRALMLAGGYYLAAKWSNAERARALRDELALVVDGNVDDFLPTVPVTIDPVHSTRVADFENARFAPSRFW
jgi:hypothetical protein